MILPRLDQRRADLPFADFVDLTSPDKPASEWCGSEVPLVELEYPGKDAKEK